MLLWSVCYSPKVYVLELGLHYSIAEVDPLGMDQNMDVVIQMLFSVAHTLVSLCDGFHHGLQEAGLCQMLALCSWASQCLELGAKYASICQLPGLSLSTLAS